MRLNLSEMGFIAKHCVKSATVYAIAGASAGFIVEQVMLTRLMTYAYENPEQFNDKAKNGEHFMTFSRDPKFNKPGITETGLQLYSVVLGTVVGCAAGAYKGYCDAKNELIRQRKVTV